MERNEIVVRDDAFEYYLKAAELEYNLRSNNSSMLTAEQYNIACQVVAKNSYQFKDIKEEVDRLKKECFWLNESYLIKSNKKTLMDLNDVKKQIDNIKREELSAKIEKENKRKEEERLKREWGEGFIRMLGSNSKFDKEMMLPYKVFFEKCESEPEVILLESLIKNLYLKPEKNTCLSNGSLTLYNQENIGFYRIDFLLNDLIIEVDGRSYHENDNSFERDRRRDQLLMADGYKTVRYTAAQVYRDSDDVVESILNIINVS
nr:DUF559 domain-containing protein [Endozoicomonas sp. YOMI1]